MTPASAEREHLRVALLVYRGNPRSGGQGVYTRFLSRELARLGHQVTVFSGQPWPALDEVDGVRLVKVPSLDLYREPDPFRFPNVREIRSWADLIELATMLTGGFPEPLTFSLRVRDLLDDAAGATTTSCTTTSPLGAGCSGSWPTAGRSSAPATTR